jgi:hypothetical protein
MKQKLLNGIFLFEQQKALAKVTITVTKKKLKYVNSIFYLMDCTKNKRSLSTLKKLENDTVVFFLLSFHESQTKHSE